MNKYLVAGVTACALTTLGLTTNVFGAVDMFLKIGDIKGEASERGGHDKWIDVLSVSWGEPKTARDAASGMATGKRMRKPTTGSSTGSGMATGKRMHKPMTVTAKPASGGPGSLTISKTVDKSSPKLQQYCNSGKSAKTVEVQKRDGDRVLSHQVLHNVTFSCHGSGDRPTESISLNYSKIEFKYTPAPKP